MTTADPAVVTGSGALNTSGCGRRELRPSVPREGGRGAEVDAGDSAAPERPVEPGPSVVDASCGPVGPRAVADRIGAGDRSTGAPPTAEGVDRIAPPAGSAGSAGPARRAVASRPGRSERTVTARTARPRERHDAGKPFRLGRRTPESRTGTGA
ncbi:hypothetical protein ACFVZ3_12145 [Kitasatospora purpeofusca]|uniref:hypothetical protein n=1 Tax=Kitasatospora purpeofusca TaxID=67352 RepID=UPI0036BF8F4F